MCVYGSAGGDRKDNVLEGQTGKRTKAKIQTSSQ